MKIISKIQDGKDDGDSNNLTGTTTNRGYVQIGDWAFTNSVGLFYFSFPISLQKLKIKTAILSIYVENYEGFIKENKQVSVSIDISNEKNAKSLRYGINRIFILEKIYLKELKTNCFINFDISDILKKVKKADRSLLLRIKIKNAKNQIWNISSADDNIFGSAQIIITTDDLIKMEENIKISDEIVCKNYNYEKEVYKIGDILLHPSHISVNGNSIINPYYTIASDQLSISISEKIKFEDSNKMLNIIGKHLPFFTPDGVYNCIVESCSLKFNVSWIDLSLNFIIF